MLPFVRRLRLGLAYCNSVVIKLVVCTLSRGWQVLVSSFLLLTWVGLQFVSFGKGEGLPIASTPAEF